jgi:hypothetical protein
MKLDGTNISDTERLRILREEETNFLGIWSEYRATDPSPSSVPVPTPAQESQGEGKSAETTPTEADDDFYSPIERYAADFRRVHEVAEIASVTPFLSLRQAF